MKTFILSLFISSLFSIFTEEDSSRIPTLKPLEECIPAGDFKFLIKRIDFIPLQENGQESPMYIEKVLLTSGGNIIISYPSSNLIFCYDNKGHFLFQFKESNPVAGKGCSNYRDICLSDDQSHLLALSAENLILKYRISDGTLEETIRPEFPRRTDFDGIAPYTAGGFILYESNPMDEKMHLGVFNHLKVFNKQGDFIDSLMPWQDYTLNANLITQSYNNSYLIRSQGNQNPCFRVKEGIPERVCDIDFGPFKAPDRALFHVEHIQEYLRSPYYKMPIFFHETPEHFYFCCCGPDANQSHFLYPQGKKQGIRWKEYEENIPVSSNPFTFKAADRQGFYGILYPHDEFDYLDKENPLKRYVLETFGIEKLRTYTFPVLVKIIFR